MSNIYIQEPPTNGKVVLKTTIGEIEIELWSRETPKACRNFIQLCMEGYYDGTIFHRVIKDFIAQGGDPTGTGQGGESIYGAPFKDEIHSRLRFSRRGLVAMANSDKDDNGSQFFFTLGPCPELTKKHTIFGKVAGQTIYNMIKFNECEVIDERPIRPEKIISTQVVYNPFNDIEPRNKRAAPKVQDDDDQDKSKQKKGVKNYGLLSFGEEAEEEEDELETVTKDLKLKKSAHDIGDPSLLSKKITEELKRKRGESSSSNSSDSDSDSQKNNNEQLEEKKADLENIRSKLKKKDDSTKSDSFKREKIIPKLDEKELKKKQTQEEIKKLEKELLMSQKKAAEENLKKEEKQKEKKQETEVFQKYKEDVEKYEHLKHKKAKSNKEDKTLELLKSFRERLFKAKSTEHKEEESQENDIEKKKDETVNEVGSFDSILTHRLDIEDEVKKKVIDANIADHDRYDIYDPRNPLNKRKREESRGIIKEKKKGYGSSANF